VTFYYDPVIGEHLELPVAVGAVPALYLAPQVPAEARRLWDAARAQTGMLQVTGPAPLLGPRFTAHALWLAREWAVTDLVQALEAACDESYPPTWDRDRGELTWDFGLAEEYPRGQYNATMAAADAVTEGAWWRLANTQSTARFTEPTVCDVDFPAVALTRAEWDAASRRLHLSLHPVNDTIAGKPTSLRITGLGDPSRWTATSPTGATVDTEVRGPDLLVTTTAGQRDLTIGPY
jgi:hypothetical protein